MQGEANQYWSTTDVVTWDKSTNNTSARLLSTHHQLVSYKTLLYLQNCAKSTEFNII